MKNKKFWISLLAGIMAVIMLLGLVLSVLPAAQAASSSGVSLTPLSPQGLAASGCSIFLWVLPMTRRGS